MDLAHITPLVLTFDEAPNLARTLDRLRWAARVVVVDSGSTDGTVEIARSFPNVEVVHRPFDSFAAQCAFGLGLVRTDWVLSLDADHVLTPGLVDELVALGDAPDVAGYTARFIFCMDGRPLRSTLYPPRVVLFRRDRGRFENDGPAHFSRLDGPVQALREPILHDDRKTLARWLRNQQGYVRQEAEKLLATPPAALGRADRLRLMGLAPFAVPFYCLLARRLALDGRAGLEYTLQRTYAEVLLALELLERRRAAAPPRTDA